MRMGFVQARVRGGLLYISQQREAANRLFISKPRRGQLKPRGVITNHLCGIRAARDRTMIARGRAPPSGAHSLNQPFPVLICRHINFLFLVLLNCRITCLLPIIIFN